MLILPMGPKPEDVANAQRLLLEVANQRVKVSIVVFGAGARPQEIASRADVRADGHPFRKVVWIPDPAVLGTEPLFEPLRVALAAGAEALALTLQFHASSLLRGPDAVSFIKLEEAFARALAGIEAP